MRADDHCARLEEELANARERIRLLEAELGANEAIPHSLRLTPTQRAILGVILKRPIASKDAIMSVVYSDHREAPGEKVVDVHLHKIRAKLKPLGMTVHTKFGTGHWMTDADKARLREMAAREAMA